MNHITSIGLDVHARSITAVALDSFTGEVNSKKFSYSSAEVASWILQFDSPKAVYESGVTGFHLVRELKVLGVDCIVGAVSKMQRPVADKRKKNDRNDAEFLARQLMAHNIVEVFVPDEETEGARNLSRALDVQRPRWKDRVEGCCHSFWMALARCRQPANIKLRIRASV